jgi:hypothetical protein
MPAFGQQMSKLISDQVEAGQSVTMKMGTVTSRESGSARAIVSFDGSSGIGQPVKCFASVVCDVGDRVGMAKFEGEWIIVGCYTLRTLADVFTSVQFASTNTTTSATYVDMPAGASVTLLKVLDSTQLRIEIGSSMWSTAVNTAFSVGANLVNADSTINTDITLYQRTINAASQHGDWTGGVETALVLPGGAYTVTGRWLRRSGTGTLTMNADDGVWIKVKEVL